MSEVDNSLQNPEHESKKKEAILFSEQAVFSLRVADKYLFIEKPGTENSQGSNAFVPLGLEHPLPVRSFSDHVLYLDKVLLPLLQSHDPEITRNDMGYEFRQEVNLTEEENKRLNYFDHEAVTASVQASDSGGELPPQNTDIYTYNVFTVNLSKKAEDALLALTKKKDTNLLLKDPETLSFESGLDPLMEAVCQEEVEVSQNIDRKLGLRPKFLKNIAKGIIRASEKSANFVDSKGSDHRLSLDDINQLVALVGDEQLKDELEESFIFNRLSQLTLTNFIAVLEAATTAAPLQSNPQFEFMLQFLGTIGVIVGEYGGNKAINENYVDLRSAVNKTLIYLNDHYWSERRTHSIPNFTDADLDIPSKIIESDKVLPMFWEVAPSLIANSATLFASAGPIEGIGFAVANILSATLVNNLSRQMRDEKISEGKKKLLLKLSNKIAYKIAFTLIKSSDTLSSNLNVQVPILNSAIYNLWLPLATLMADHLSPYIEDADKMKMGEDALEVVREVIQILSLNRLSLVTEKQFAEHSYRIINSLKEKRVSTEDVRVNELSFINNLDNSPTDSDQEKDTQDKFGVFDTVNSDGSITPYEFDDLQEPSSSTSLFRRLKKRILGDREPPVDHNQVKRYALLDAAFGVCPPPDPNKPEVLGIYWYDFTDVAGKTPIVKNSTNIASDTGLLEIDKSGEHLLKALSQSVVNPSGTVFLRTQHGDLNLHIDGGREMFGYFDCTDSDAMKNYKFFKGVLPEKPKPMNKSKDSVTTIKEKEEQKRHYESEVQQLREKLKNLDLFDDTQQVVQGEDGEEKLSELEDCVRSITTGEPLTGNAKSLRARLLLAEAALSPNQILCLNMPFDSFKKKDKAVIERVARFLSKLSEKKHVIFNDNRTNRTFDFHINEFVEQGNLKTYLRQDAELSPYPVPIPELRKALTEHQINFDSWGKNGTKSINGLADEIRKGECELVIRNGELHRKVGVAHIRVRYKGLELIEEALTYETEFSKSATKRDVNGQPIEGAARKIANGQTPKEAAVRCLKHELKIGNQQLLPLEDTELAARIQQFTENSIETDIRDSNSYPGLPTEYEIHNFEIELTDAEFNEFGYHHDMRQEGTSKDPTRSLEYRWRKAETPQTDEAPITPPKTYIPE